MQMLIFLSALLLAAASFFSPSSSSSTYVAMWSAIDRQWCLWKMPISPLRYSDRRSLSFLHDSTSTSLSFDCESRPFESSSASFLGPTPGTCCRSVTTFPLFRFISRLPPLADGP